MTVGSILSLPDIVTKLLLRLKRILINVTVRLWMKHLQIFAELFRDSLHSQILMATVHWISSVPETETVGSVSLLCITTL